VERPISGAFLIRGDGPHVRTNDHLGAICAFEGESGPFDDQPPRFAVDGDEAPAEAIVYCPVRRTRLERGGENRSRYEPSGLFTSWGNGA
jgi:hypothetical protein